MTTLIPRFFVIGCIFFLALNLCKADIGKTPESMSNRLSVEQKGLLDEYHNNYCKLKKFYHNALMIASMEMRSYRKIVNGETFYLPVNETPVLLYRQNYEYRSNCDEKAEYFRLDECTGNDNSSSKYRRIGIVSPQNCYLLEKNSSEKKYYSILAKKKEQDLEGPSVYDCIFPFAAFSEKGYLLEYLLFQQPEYASQCTIDDISVFTENGEQIVAIKMTAIAKNGGGSVKYHFSFYRNHSWVLKSSIVEVDNNIQITNNQFEFVENEIPRIKEIKIEAKSSDGTKRYYIKNIRISKFVPGPVPLSEFDVAQFLP